MSYINSTDYPKDTKREVRGWAFYDWANSAFSTTVVTVFFGPFLTAIAKASANSAGYLYIGNIPIKYDSYFAFVVAASVLIQVAILPILGALADYSHLRKKLLILFATLGSVVTMLMFFLDTVTTGMYILAAVLFILANVSFGASVIFYNAFLPDIASEETRDRVSTYAWAVGYLGGGLLLFINLLMFALSPFSEELTVRLSLFSAGLWWFAFSFVTFVTVKSRHKQVHEEKKLYLTAGFAQLAKLLDVSTTLVILLTFSPFLIPVLFVVSVYVTPLPVALIILPAFIPLITLVIFSYRKYHAMPEMVKFLIAFLLYNDGVQTVIVEAAIYAKEIVKVSDTTLILLILFIQFVGIAGAMFFGWLADRIGNKKAILISLVIWAIITIYAYVGLKNTAKSPFGLPWNQVELWILGFLIAVVLGGSQALSRSLFSLMIPKNQETEFFSFYELSNDGTGWLGTFIFGVANQLTNSLRFGVLSLIVFFILGLLILPFVNVKKGVQEAKDLQEQTAIAVG